MPSISCSMSSAPGKSAQRAPRALSSSTPRTRSAAAAVRALRVFVAGALLVVFGAGGGAMQAKSKLKVETLQNVAGTQEQLRGRVRAMVGPMCGRIEREADAVVAGTSDRNVQLAAIAWEIDAVTSMREALYQPEPVIAAVDAMTLCNQMAGYFETGAGKSQLGPASARLADACRQMLAEMT